MIKLNKDTILVVVAMEVEAKVLLEKLGNYTVKKVKDFIFYEGFIEEKKVVILLTGVGVINSSSAMMVGIMEYNPNIIINYGIGGAMSREIHTKDIIVGSSVVNINSYRTCELEEGQGSRPNDWELNIFKWTT